MRATRNYKTVIMSAFVNGASNQENYMRHCNLQQDLLSDFKYKIVTGHYRGTEEYSLVIPCKENDVRILSSIAAHYEQECILVINEDDSCFLLFPNGKTENLGIFKAVNKNRALESQNYTYDHNDDTYYMAV